jgi:hypothetical protein
MEVADSPGREFQRRRPVPDTGADQGSVGDLGGVLFCQAGNRQLDSLELALAGALAACPSSTGMGSRDGPSHPGLATNRRSNTSHRSLRSQSPNSDPPPRPPSRSTTHHSQPAPSSTSRPRRSAARSPPSTMKSIPTYCRSTGASLSPRRNGLWKPRVSNRTESSRGAEAPLLHRIRYAPVPCWFTRHESESNGCKSERSVHVGVLEGRHH